MDWSISAEKWLNLTAKVGHLSDDLAKWRGFIRRDKATAAQYALTDSAGYLNNIFTDWFDGLGTAFGCCGFQRLSAANRLMDLAKSQKRCPKSGGYSVP
eukprot:scaffold248468_cov80-Cyclotella_meneghiniana.AAC.1